jgi:uncharacterized protein (UPF0332 family)
MDAGGNLLYTIFMAQDADIQVDSRLRDQIRRYIDMADEDLLAAGLLLEKRLYRASVNRSFYACYQMVNGALISQSIDPERTKKKNLLSAFKTIFTFDSQLIEPEYCRVFEQLQHMRRSGEKADAVPHTQEDAEWAFREAKRFVERLK